jgi:hypothetical protein
MDFLHEDLCQPANNGITYATFLPHRFSESQLWLQRISSTLEDIAVEHRIGSFSGVTSAWKKSRTQAWSSRLWKATANIPELGASDGSY